MAVDTISAAPHESALVKSLFDFMLTEEPPDRIIGEKVCDSNPLDETLTEHGIEMIAPRHRSRKSGDRVVLLLLRNRFSCLGVN